MTRHTIIRSAVTLTAVSALAGCNNSVITAPKGYVSVNDHYGYDYKAVSAHGSVFALTAHENAGGPSADLTFWTAAVEHHKVDLDGYRLNGREAIETKAHLKGTLFDLRHGTGGGEYTYLIALFVTPRKVYTVESGGPSAEMSKDMTSIKEAMQTLSVGGI